MEGFLGWRVVVVGPPILKSYTLKLQMFERLVSFVLLYKYELKFKTFEENTKDLKLSIHLSESNEVQMFPQMGQYRSKNVKHI